MARAESDADRAITEIYTSHYGGFVRLATLLLRDQAVAEEIVQDAFVELHKRWNKLRDTNAAVGYVRTSVVHKAHSVGRRRGLPLRGRDARCA